MIHQINFVTLILWSSWKIRMMSWYYRILCQLIPGEYKWIILMFLEGNNLEGKQYHFLKSIQVDEQEELSGKWRTELLYKKLQVRDNKKRRVGCGHKWGVWISQAKARVKCQEKRHSEEEQSIVTLNWSSDHSVHWHYELMKSRRHILNGEQAI